jgi:hypothetical protein
MHDLCKIKILKIAQVFFLQFCKLFDVCLCLQRCKILSLSIRTLMRFFPNWLIEKYLVLMSFEELINISIMFFYNIINNTKCNLHERINDDFANLLKIIFFAIWKPSKRLSYYIHITKTQKLQKKLHAK